MEIIKKTEGLTPADLYALTKGNDVRKMADAKGEVLDELREMANRIPFDDRGNPDISIDDISKFTYMMQIEKGVPTSDLNQIRTHIDRFV